MVPVSEVETKINELQQKLIEVTSENEIYKAMIDRMKGSSTFDKDAFDSAKAAMEEQSKKMGEIQRQNIELQNEVKVLSNRASSAISRQISNAEINISGTAKELVDVETNTEEETLDEAIHALPKASLLSTRHLVSSLKT